MQRACTWHCAQCAMWSDVSPCSLLCFRLSPIYPRSSSDARARARLALNASNLRSEFAQIHGHLRTRTTVARVPWSSNRQVRRARSSTTRAQHAACEPRSMTPLAPPCCACAASTSRRQRKNESSFFGGHFRGMPHCCDLRIDPVSLFV